jgi:hypothetical protein
MSPFIDIAAVEDNAMLADNLRAWPADGRHSASGGCFDGRRAAGHRVLAIDGSSEPTSAVQAQRQRVLRLLVEDALIGPDKSPSGTASPSGKALLATRKPPARHGRATISPDCPLRWGVTCRKLDRLQISHDGK